MLKRVNNICIVFFSLILIISCGTKDYSIIGSWTGVDNIGTRQTFNFKEGGTITWKIENDHFSTTIDGEYIHSKSETPNQIDIFNFKSGPMKGRNLYGLIEFVDENKFKIDLRSGTDSSVRPEAFTAESVLYDRIIE